MQTAARWMWTREAIPLCADSIKKRRDQRSEATGFFTVGVSQAQRRSVIQNLISPLSWLKSGVLLT